MRPRVLQNGCLWCKLNISGAVLIIQTWSSTINNAKGRDHTHRKIGRRNYTFCICIYHCKQTRVLSYMRTHTPYLLPLEMLWSESGSAGPRLPASQVTGARVSLNISEKDSEREVAADRVSKSAIPSAVCQSPGLNYKGPAPTTHAGYLA